MPNEGAQHNSSSNPKIFVLDEEQMDCTSEEDSYYKTENVILEEGTQKRYEEFMTEEDRTKRMLTQLPGSTENSSYYPFYCSSMVYPRTLKRSYSIHPISPQSSSFANPEVTDDFC